MYYLSASDKCEINEIPDIGDVEDVVKGQKGSAGGGGKVVKGKVISVTSSEEYVSCVMCASKLADSGTTNIVQCEKCGAKMHKTSCSTSKIAKVVIESLCPTGRLNTKKWFRVTIFDNVLSKMIGDGTLDIDTELLEAAGLEFKIRKNIVSCAKPL